MSGMLNENAQKLVDALRSGKYAQTQGVLRDDNGYCCLGVACEISGLGLWDSPTAYGGRAYVVQTNMGEARDMGVLPTPVRDWLGFSHNDGGVDHRTNLSSMNDNGATFEEIADYIESEPGDLFVV